MFNPKTLNPHLSNNIPQMRSGEFQPRFIAGGNQVAYYLGIKGNSNTEPEPCGEGCYSSYKKVIKKHRKK
jgi:hypothetical protein